MSGRLSAKDNKPLADSRYDERRSVRKDVHTENDLK